MFTHTPFSFENTHPFKEPLRRESFKNTHPFKEPLRRVSFKNTHPFKEPLRRVSFQNTKEPPRVQPTALVGAMS